MWKGINTLTMIILLEYVNLQSFQAWLFILSTLSNTVVQSMEKEIHLKIDKDDPDMTLRVVMEKIQELQDQNPELEVFFDGDEYAICSRPKREI